MSRIFISYRRSDSAAGYVLSLRNRLFERFGRRSVFLDINRVDPGDDFVDLVQTQLANCEVCVVWIGREWLMCRDAQGTRRLDNPNDLVRKEVSAALRRHIAIPVLVGSTPPRREDLPDELQPLADIDAIEIRHARFDDDLEVLLDYLEQRVTRSPWVPALAMALSWIIPPIAVTHFGLFVPFYVGRFGMDDAAKPLIPFLINGASVGVGMSFAVWWMRRDATRALLGLLCLVWIVAWFGVAFAVAKIDFEYVHPISAFPGGIYSVAVAVGAVGGLGTAALLRWFRRLTDRRWLVAIALTWPIGCGLSAALLNGAARIWTIHPFANLLVFDIANALAGAVAGGIGSVVLTLALYRATPAAAPSGGEGGVPARTA